MDDQALDVAVAPAIEDRIAAALGTQPEQVSLEQPQSAEIPAGAVEGAPQETPEAAPQEEVEEPLKWDEIREVKLRVPLKNGAEEKEIEATIEELRLGYMRTDDYQRKTQEIARAKEAAALEARQAIAENQQKVEQELNTLGQWLDQVAMPELGKVDWNKLATEDPAQFVQLSHRANQLRAARQQIAQKQQAVIHQRNLAEQQARAQALAQAAEQLKTEIPNWGDELQRSLVQKGSEMGFSQDELASVSDPRFVKLLLKAKEFDDLQSQKPIADKKVTEAPRVLKPSAPQSKSTEGAKVDALRARIKKSGGRDKDAIEDLIKTRMRR